MGRGINDGDLIDAIELEMRGIPGFMRFGKAKRYVVFSLALFFLVLAIVCFIFDPSNIFGNDSNLAFSFMLIKIPFIFVSLFLCALLMLWMMIGVHLEKKAFARACILARDNDEWERHKFRRDLEKTLKDSNYKN